MLTDSILIPKKEIKQCLMFNILPIIKNILNNFPTYI